MIPKDMNRKHIALAAEEIDHAGIPKNRDSRKFLVEVGKGQYPPKYIVSLAAKHIYGKELDPSEFITTEARKTLESLGYKIIKK